MLHILKHLIDGLVLFYVFWLVWDGCLIIQEVFNENDAYPRKKIVT